jgi:hypothetical protein
MNDESPEAQAAIFSELLSRYLAVPLHLFDDPRIQAGITDIFELIRGSAYHV